MDVTKLSSVILGIGLAVLPVGCGKSSGGKAAASRSGDSAMTSGTSAMGSMGAGMDAMRPRPREAMGPASAITDGPTGVAECDQALDIICRCAKKNISLREGCKTLKRDASRWKTEARNQDPGQLADLRKSCARILSSIQQAYGCK